jgi:hypothetical protein
MQITINNLDYDVQMSDKNDKDIGDGVRGIILYEELIIKLLKTLPDELKVETLYHELCHALCEQSSFNNMLMEKLGDNGYEIFIDSLSKALYTLVHKNDLKKLENFISEDSE